MDDGPAFLRAIRANPSDNSIRLVYADWLQENGWEAWAELIRVQIELSKPAPRRPTSMAIDLYSTDEHIGIVDEWRKDQRLRPGFDRREREILATFRPPLPAGWVLGRGIGHITRGERGDLYFRRGLAERAVCGGPVWLDDADAVLAHHPVERVRLTTRPAYGEFGRRLGRDGVTEYLHSFATTAKDDPNALWIEYQPDDDATGRVLLQLLARRWPTISFELPR